MLSTGVCGTRHSLRSPNQGSLLSVLFYVLRDADTSLVQLRLSLDVVTCWHSFMFFLLSDAFVPASSEKIRWSKTKKSWVSMGSLMHFLCIELQRAEYIICKVSGKVLAKQTGSLLLLACRLKWERIFRDETDSPEIHCFVDFSKKNNSCVKMFCLMSFLFRTHHIKNNSN